MKEHQIKFFTVDLNDEISLKCILAKFNIFASCRFQDIAVQNQQFFPYFSVANLSVF